MTGRPSDGPTEVSGIHDAGLALALVGLAFVLRLGWGLAAGVVPGGAGFDDAAWYHTVAVNLAHGGGYLSPFTGQPTAAWPPGYPLTLALGYRLAGAAPTTAVAMNAVFGALTCFFVWRLGIRLGGARLGLVATALLAIFPSQIFFTALVLSETLFTCLMMGLVLAALRLLDGEHDLGAGAWVVWGLAAGGAALVRSEGVLLTAVPALALAARGHGRAAARTLATVLLGVAIALTPWTLRNLRVFGTFVPTSTSFGRTLWIGHNPGADGAMSHAIQLAMYREIVAGGPFSLDAAGEIAIDRMLRRQALAFAVANPGRELALTPARTYHLFRGDHVWQAWYEPGTPRLFPSTAARDRLGAAGNVYYLLVGLAAVAGWWLRPREPRVGWHLLDALILTWVAIFSAIYGDPRFHHLLVPPACLLAGATVVRIAPGHDTGERHAAAIVS